MTPVTPESLRALAKAGHTRDGFANDDAAAWAAEAEDMLNAAADEIARLTAQTEALADALSDVLSGGNPIIDDERARAALADYREGRK